VLVLYPGVAAGATPATGKVGAGLRTAPGKEELQHRRLSWLNLPHAPAKAIVGSTKEDVMIEKTIGKIAKKISGADAIGDEKKSELLGLLDTLQTEVEDLEQTQTEHAESIRRFTEVSAHEAMRSEKNQRSLELALDGLASSVEGFEASHPKLVEIVNAMCHMLANIGI